MRPPNLLGWVAADRSTLHGSVSFFQPRLSARIPAVIRSRTAGGMSPA